MILFFTIIIISIYALRDLFLVTGSKVKVFHEFFPLGFYIWFLAQTFLPNNESQGETKFCFHCFLSILWYNRWSGNNH